MVVNARKSHVKPYIAIFLSQTSNYEQEIMLESPLPQDMQALLENA